MGFIWSVILIGQGYISQFYVLHLNSMYIGWIYISMFLFAFSMVWMKFGLCPVIPWNLRLKMSPVTLMEIHICQLKLGTKMLRQVFFRKSLGFLSSRSKVIGHEPDTSSYLSGLLWGSWGTLLLIKFRIYWPNLMSFLEVAMAT